MVEAWRYWKVLGPKLPRNAFVRGPSGATLAAPVMGSTLPPGGVYTAHCDRHAEPPATGCYCGVCYWPDRLSMKTAADKLNVFRGRDTAITVGVAEGAILPDECRPRWVPQLTGAMSGMSGPLVSGGVAYTPSAWRCATYRVTAILSPYTHRFCYDVPVVRGTDLSLLDAR